MQFELRPSRPHRHDRDDDMPAIGVLLGLNAACILLLLAALSPFLALSGVFAGAVCLVAIRKP